MILMIIRKGKLHVIQMYLKIKSYHSETECRKLELSSYAIDGEVEKTMIRA